MLFHDDVFHDDGHSKQLEHMYRKMAERILAVFVPGSCPGHCVGVSKYDREKFIVQEHVPVFGVRKCDEQAFVLVFGVKC